MNSNKSISPRLVVKAPSCLQISHANPDAPVANGRTTSEFARVDTLCAQTFTTHAYITLAANQGAPSIGRPHLLQSMQTFLSSSDRRHSFSRDCQSAVPPRLKKQRVADFQEVPSTFPLSLSLISSFKVPARFSERLRHCAPIFLVNMLPRDSRTVRITVQQLVNGHKFIS